MALSERQIEAEKALVLGLGQTGVSIAAWLAGRGAQAVFTDSRSQPPGQDKARELLPDAEFLCGEIPARVPAGVTEVYVSPGLPLDLPLLADARSLGLSVRSDIDLFMDACPGTVIGITGSNGKSTVTALTAAMLNAAGSRAVAGGNLGTPVLELLDRDADIFVLELSSFQLERSSELPLHAAVVLNVTPDHIDHHGDMARYAAAKARIYSRCATAVVNRDEPELANMLSPGTRQVGFGLGKPSPTDWGVIERDDGQWIARGTYAVMPVTALQLSGRHNLQNVLAAFALADTLTGSYDLPLDGLVAGAENFAGLPHRMQLVAVRNGVCWIDDSKATNEGAALASVSSVTGPLILIAGGDAKGGELRQLATLLKERQVPVIALGKDRDVLLRQLGTACKTFSVDSMDAAVRVAADIAREGDTVLLAPGCSSLDMFASFEQRGDLFARAVQEYCR